MSEFTECSNCRSAWCAIHKVCVSAPAMTNPQPKGADELLAEGSFQQRVGVWAETCFPPAVVYDRLERRDRLVEEALELAQTLPEFTADRAHALVDYVFSRPPGVTEQEAGGVSITLVALCHAEGIDQQHWAEVELARISEPETIEKIRAKQAAKPKGSALPMAVRTPPSVTDEEIVERGWLIEEDGPHWITLPQEPWPTMELRHRKVMGGSFECDDYRDPIRRTKNAGEALRFARKEDAEVFMTMFARFLLSPVATEHEWSRAALQELLPVMEEGS